MLLAQSGLKSRKEKASEEANPLFLVDPLGVIHPISHEKRQHIVLLDPHLNVDRVFIFQTKFRNFHVVTVDQTIDKTIIRNMLHINVQLVHEYSYRKLPI
jgi:PIN domain nuclease of toxin-antitoxin system